MKHSRSVNSKAGRLPRRFLLKSQHTQIVSREEYETGTMVRAFDLLAGFPDDFAVDGRKKNFPQKRKIL